MVSSVPDAIPLSRQLMFYIKMVIVGAERRSPGSEHPSYLQCILEISIRLSVFGDWGVVDERRDPTL